MGHVDLVAKNISHYTDLAVKLLTDDDFQRQQAEAVFNGFHNNLHRNGAVAREWLSFIFRYWRSI